MMRAIFDKRLLFVMGKGGVGKSFVASLLAHLALRQGKRVLLVQINTEDKIAGYLGTAKADEDIRQMLPNLYGVNINPEAAMKEYVLLQVKLEIIYKLVFQNRAVKYFLRAVPALNDLVILGKIYYHVNQVNEKTGNPLYDIVIVDAPPTGHGLFLLRLPFVMISAVRGGPVRKEAQGMLNMLQNPELTNALLVSLPEEMPASETKEMYETIRDELHIPMGGLFINQIAPCHLTNPDIEMLDKLKQTELTNDKGFRELCDIIDIQRARYRMGKKYIDELKSEIQLPSVEIEQVLHEVLTADMTAEVASEIAERMGIES